METRLLLLSDVHLCHLEWYGQTSYPRMEHMMKSVLQYNQENPVDAFLMLGDFALDFWVCSIGGSYLGNPPVSNTANFVRDFVPRFPRRPFMIPGNHEQYSNKTWKEITGYDRQYAITVGGWRILMMDTFAGNLDPDYHHDGVYTGPDEAFIRKELESCSLPMILCAHDFCSPADSESVRALIRDEPRIKALFAGHSHQSIIEPYEGKPLMRTGHYSYGGGDVKRFMPGYREVILNDHSISTRYITPENTLLLDDGVYHHDAGEQDMLTITF